MSPFDAFVARYVKVHVWGTLALLVGLAVAPDATWELCTWLGEPYKWLCLWRVLVLGWTL